MPKPKAKKIKGILITTNKMKKLLLFLSLAFSINANAQCWSQISTGTLHTLAIKTDGTLWAWGYNGFGQLGDGTNTNNNASTQIGTATNWSQISTGGYHTIAIKTDGTLWAWGMNSSGQLGDGTTSDKNVPTKIGTATNWSQISAGNNHTLAIKTDGTLWAWGVNLYGQLGDGTNTAINAPTQIGTDNNWSLISAGGEHSLALKIDGTLWAWGYNGWGALGDGTTSSGINAPTQIGTDNNWSQISAGDYHTLAIKTDGTLWACGSNSNGQLGDGTNSNYNTVLTKIGSATNWSQICAGGNHTLASKTNGTLWAWGYNLYGALGDGTNTDKNVPTQLGIATNWSEIIAGGDHTLAIKTDGTLWAWGDNSFGQLGDRTDIDKNTPNSIGCSNNIAIPNLTTTGASSITSYTASSGGNITTDGGASVTARGVCWNTTGSPTIADAKTSDGSGIGSFTSTITGLSPSTTYKVRAYATNSVGTAYGNEITVNTLSINITTTAASSITGNTASSGGNITTDGGVSVIARGVCWNTSGSPTIADAKTSDGSGIGSFTSTMTGLSPSTTYKVRAWASNSFGTAYGNEITLNTLVGVGIKENNIDNSISLYPNPTNGKIQISNTKNKVQEVGVYNMLGERIYSSSTTQYSSFEIDLSTQPNGIYFVEIKIENEKVFKKAIKE